MEIDKNPFIPQELRIAHKVLKNLGRDMKLFGGYVRQMPHLAHGLFKRLATESPRIELAHTGLEDTSKKFENGVNRLTLRIGQNIGKYLLPHHSGVRGLKEIDFREIIMIAEGGADLLIKIGLPLLEYLCIVRPLQLTEGFHSPFGRLQAYQQHSLL